jgi:RluA family pseudouridine synthase
MRLIERIREMLKISGKEAKRLLDARKVFVNGKRIWIAGFEVSQDDRIDVQGSEKGINDDKHKPEMPEILFQDAYFLIINKPAGILSTGPGSLETLLRKKLSNPGITASHRLDRDTTGANIFALTPEAGTVMEKLFLERKIIKTYRAIVTGRFPSAGMVINMDIDGQNAITTFSVLKSNALASDLSILLGTGRTHQIRKHLKQTGFMLLGEKQYNTGVIRNELFRKVPRQMLHAWNLAFQHPFTGLSIDLTADLPADMIKTLKELDL